MLANMINTAGQMREASSTVRADKGTIATALRLPAARAVVAGGTVPAVAAVVLVFSASALAGVKQWGSNAGAHTVPLPTVVENVENVIAVDASNLSDYVLESNGTMWAFGENGDGELGDGLSTPSLENAVQVSFPGGVRIVAIGEAQNSGFAIDSTGQGWSWGQGNVTLCLGEDAGKTRTPQKVPGMTNALAVQGGEHHVLWLLKTGTIEACGTNLNGQLGLGSKVRKTGSPVAVPGLSGVVEISAGEKTSCARASSGAVYDWGADYNGQIGNAVEEASVYEPFKVPLPGPASQISCGGNLPENGHAFALVKNVVYGWGADGFGQVGDGQTTNKLAPVVATAVRTLGLKHVVASGAYSLGLNAAGNVYAWGSDAGEALGTGEGESLMGPVLVDTGVAEISGTAQHSLDR